LWAEGSLQLGFSRLFNFFFGFDGLFLGVFGLLGGGFFGLSLLHFSHIIKLIFANNKYF
jgi:hypothetical protein